MNRILCTIYIHLVSVMFWKYTKWEIYAQRVNIAQTDTAVAKANNGAQISAEKKTIAQSTAHTPTIHRMTAPEKIKIKNWN